MLYTKILIVEDEQIVAKNIEKRLTSGGYEVVAFASTGEEAIEKVQSLLPDIILMDIKLKGKMDGIETADFIRKNYQLPVIFLTSYTDEETFQRAKITEPFGFLIKPFDIKELNRSVEIAIYKNKIYRELLDTKLRFEIAIKAGKTGVWEFWPTKKKYYGDKNLKSLYGFEEKELSDDLDAWSSLVYKDDQEIMSETFNNFLKSSKHEFKLEHRIYKKDGSIGWVVDHGLLFEADNNKPLRLIGTTTDITERKEAEIELQKSEEKFRNVFESSGMGMAITGPDGQYTKVNQTFCEMIGYKENEILKSNFRDFTHPGDLEKSIELTRDLLKSESSESGFLEKRYLHKNGEVIWAITTVSLIRDFKNKPLYFIAQIRDITKRKRYEEQLLKYADELKTLNAAKDKFFSIISHDLRNPFNSLLGVTEFIAQSYDEMSPAEIRDSVSNIYRSSQQVYNLILNLLEWSRLQTGRSEVEKTELNISKMIDDVISLYDQNAIAKKIVISRVPSEELIAYADKYMIETVLRNLISNAIKFTPKGGRVIAECFKKENFVEVIITDNGIGISQENQNKLFKIDEQFKTDGTANEKGTGLGLILCKEFVEKNSGRITLESMEGKGTKMLFTMPIASRST